MADELPADFERRYGLIEPDHGGVDLGRLRRHHQAVVRRLRRELRARRELEAECERLQRLVVEIAVRWYGASAGDVDETLELVRLPGGLGGSSSFAFGGFLTPPTGPDDAGEG
jgi:hypothetical protein